MGHPEVPDGAGEDAPSRSDLKLYERAIRDRWPMAPSTRVEVLRQLVRILDDDAWEGESPHARPGTREKIAAARALLAADRLNLDAERLDAARAGKGAAEVRIVREARPIDPVRDDDDG